MARPRRRKEPSKFFKDAVMLTERGCEEMVMGFYANEFYDKYNVCLSFYDDQKDLEKTFQTTIPALERAIEEFKIKRGIIRVRTKKESKSASKR